MKPKLRCVHCRHRFNANPRVNNQKYCNRACCQRARKTRWQRHKMTTDADYQQNQKDSHKGWGSNLRLTFDIFQQESNVYLTPDPKGKSSHSDSPSESG